MDDYELRIGTPNCPKCLALLWPAGSDSAPYWFCAQCKVPVIL